MLWCQPALSHKIWSYVFLTCSSKCLRRICAAFWMCVYMSFVYRIRGGFRFEGASGDVQCRLLLEVVLAVQIRLVEADPHWCWELLGTTSLVAFSNAGHFFLVGKIWSAYFWCLVWDVWFSAQVWQTVTIFFPTLNVFLCLYDTLHTKRELHSWCSMFVVPIFQYFGKCWLYGKAEVTAMTRKIPKANILVHFCL